MRRAEAAAEDRQVGLRRFVVTRGEEALRREDREHEIGAERLGDLEDGILRFAERDGLPRANGVAWPLQPRQEMRDIAGAVDKIDIEESARYRCGAKNQLVAETIVAARDVEVEARRRCRVAEGAGIGDNFEQLVALRPGPHRDRADGALKARDVAEHLAQPIAIGAARDEAGNAGRGGVGEIRLEVGAAQAQRRL